ncbi:MAG TPA: ATP-binding protein [Gemmatimonadales bacterium]|nr:ATP-binding protein [Gemmatimonadales bacterium]
MATPPIPTRRPRTLVERLTAPGVLTMATWIIGVSAIALAWAHRPLAFVLGSVAILLGTTALWRGRVLGRRRSAKLQAALDAADSRNHELEALRHLAQVLLTGESLPELLTEVCRYAADLLDGEAAGLGLVVEEGRFIRIAAGTGLMQHAVDRLVPTDRSLAGWVVSHGESIVVDDMSTDARNFEFPDTPRELRSAAWTPLRTGGLVIGVIGVFNRRGGLPFTESDLEQLRTLADQAALGFDRAHMHEESQRTAHELARKNVELQRATKLKNEFLANVSHELRTPLNAIIGFSELLLTGDLGAVRPEHKDFLESIHRNGRHLLRLINSVLDVSRIDAERMELELTETDLTTAIRGAAADTESLRLAKQQTCRLELPDQPLHALADAVRVQQILFNLLSNAAKFTPEGGEVVLRALATSTPLPVPGGRLGERPRLERRDAVWVSVGDTGIGIRPEDLGKLFQEFSQVDASASRRVQGSGLGLALSKRLVELHGGQIGCESIYTKGSTFWFILPTDGPVRRPGTKVPE